MTNKGILGSAKWGNNGILTNSTTGQLRELTLGTSFDNTFFENAGTINNATVKTGGALYSTGGTLGLGYVDRAGENHKGQLQLDGGYFEGTGSQIGSLLFKGGDIESYYSTVSNFILPDVTGINRYNSGSFSGTGNTIATLTIADTAKDVHVTVDDEKVSSDVSQSLMLKQSKANVDSVSFGTVEGTVTNVSGGQIGSVGSVVIGGIVNNSSQVGSIGVSGGTVNNDGQIGNTSVSTGLVNNTATGTIDTAAIYGGTFVNDGTIDTATIYGEGLKGTGRIDNVVIGSGGLFDTVTFTGTVGDLSFAENTGVIRFEALQTTGDIGFTSLASNGLVNLTGANILIDFSGLFNAGDDALEFGFQIDIADLFDFYGNGGFLGSDWWTDIAVTTLGASDYDWTSVGGGVFQYGVADSETPEPATMLIIGLGLAGLGLARRRRK
ncbi:hypothetical protein FACS1894170_10590 [Planctomycetales bacterium]|nr:hypothetical protein FACS1894170_10590 [Planctomycetales bacterium]